MCWLLFWRFNKTCFSTHVNLPTNEENCSWRKQFSLKFWWKKLSLSVEQKMFQQEPHSSISPEIFSKQKPSSLNDRVKNALISFRIALLKHTSFKANRKFFVKAKARSSILAPLFSFFRFKHYSELNWNVFLKIYDTATFKLSRFLLIHTYVYTL